MKTFFVSAVTAGVLAYGAYFILNSNWQATSATAYTTSGARVGDPGGNLMGTDWPAAAESEQDS